MLTGESEPSYLSHPNAPGRWPAASPARLLVLLRDPAARAASHWAWCLRQCGETRSFREAVEAEIGPPGDASGLRIPADKRVSDPLVVRRGIYQPQLERWVTHFPREHSRHRQRALVPRDRRVMAEVCDFLELPACRAARRCATATSRTSPTTRVLARLREFYRPHNERLADFLGIELGWP